MSNGYSTIAALLKECARTGDLARAIQLHDRIASTGFRSTVLENLVLRIYCNCASLDEAVDAFARICCRNVFSWNTILSGIAQRGHLVFARMVLDLFPEFDTVSHNILLAACVRSGALIDVVDRFHRVPEKDLASWNTLLTAFAGRGRFAETKNTFDSMPQRNLLSWNTMLTGDFNLLGEFFERMPQRCLVSWTMIVSAHAQQGHFRTSWSLFLAMPERSVVSINSAMQALVRAGCCEETVKTIFHRMPERSLVSFNLRLGVARDSVEAMALLESMPERNIASWTLLLTAFSKNCGYETLQPAEIVFSSMPQWDGLSCNAMACLYSEAEDVVSTMKIFDSNHQKDVASWNILITSYGRRGDVESTGDFFEKMPLHSMASFTAMLLAFSRSSEDDHSSGSNARKWFESMPFQDSISWNAVIFAAAGQKECFQLLRRMELEGIKPTYVTYATVIDFCADAAALPDGRTIHERILQLGYFPENVVIGNALINFYSRCGSVKEAYRAFERIRKPDLITWSTMVAGYAWNGLGQSSAQLFQCMMLEGFDPNSVTLVNILASCSHGGLLDFAKRFFVFVTTEIPGFVACREHYDCMVDLLGRSGRVEEAQELMESMPFEPSLLGRMSFAASCERLN